MQFKSIYGVFYFRCFPLFSSLCRCVFLLLLFLLRVMFFPFFIFFSHSLGLPSDYFQVNKCKLVALCSFYLSISFSPVFFSLSLGSVSLFSFTLSLCHLNHVPSNLYMFIWDNWARLQPHSLNLLATLSFSFFTSSYSYLYVFCCVCLSSFTCCIFSIPFKLFNSFFTYTQIQPTG